MQSFLLPANGKATPESIKRKRRMAELMMSQGMDASPIASPWQGAARMAQSLVGGMASRRADEQDFALQAETKREQMARQLIEDNRYNAQQAMPKLQSLGNGQFMQYDPRDPQGSNEAFTPEGYNPTMADAGSEYGLQPIVTQEGPNDPNPGKYHLYQAGKNGQQPKEIELPFGWTPKMQFLNQETQFAPVATQGILQPGQGPSPVPINNAQAAADTKLGGEAGEAAALNASLASKMPGLQRVIGELETLADEATYTQAGQAYNTARKELGISPTPAAVARAKYIAMVDNQVLPMLRDTFGSQFTVVEGESLRATLGDPNKPPEEKKAVLRAFIEQKARNIEASAVQGNVAPAPTQNQTQRLRFNPTTGDFE